MLFLKYNIKNTQQERRLLEFKEIDVNLSDNDDYYTIKFTTDYPHNLNIGDKVLFIKEITTAKNYTEAKSILEKDRKQIIHVLNDEEIEDKNVYGETFFTTQHSGYYCIKYGNIELINDYEINSQLDKYNSYNDGLKIDSKPSEYIFTVNINKYKEVNVKSIDTKNNSIIINYKDALPQFYDKDDKITFIKRYFYYQEIDGDNNDYHEVDVNPQGYSEYLGYDYVSFLGKVYKWVEIKEKIPATVQYLTEFKFDAPIENLNVNDRIEIEDKRFIRQITSNDIIKYYLYNVSVYEYEEFINLNIPINSSNSNELNDEEMSKNYFEEIKKSLIPEIIDYEKRCFSPYHKVKLETKINIKDAKNNNDDNTNSIVQQITDQCNKYRSNFPLINTNVGILEDVLFKVNRINFNLFFRDRSANKIKSQGIISIDYEKDNGQWVTSDIAGWTQYPTRYNGPRIYFEKKNKITNGDLLGTLNFTDDDIYYQKQKVKKSFLRLSFYDSNNPLNQMLLFYSTIFLDTNELYSKYIKRVPIKISENNKENSNNRKTPYQIVDNYVDGDSENDLTARFSVYDRFNRNKSSEGYYLYLFPYNIKKGEDKTIYMKVEFNHAGYGSTIPFILPHNEDGELLDFGADDFPTSLIKLEDNNLRELYRQLYIPLTLSYDETIGDYIYYFKYADFNNGEINFNLYEPRLNPTDIE